MFEGRVLLVVGGVLLLLLLVLVLLLPFLDVEGDEGFDVALFGLVGSFEGNVIDEFDCKGDSDREEVDEDRGGVVLLILLLFLLFVDVVELLASLSFLLLLFSIQFIPKCLIP